MGDSERWSAAALVAMSGIGPRRMRRLRDYFGNWTAAWAAGPPGWLQALGLQAPPVEWRQQWQPQLPERIERLCHQYELVLLTADDALFPDQLHRLGDEMPPVLFVREPAVISGVGVTVVGTRRSTQYGLNSARHIARAVVEAGGIVFSGMAFGIDAAAHTATCDYGGTTVAVVAAGPELPSPRTNRHIYDRILRNGAVVSEYPPGTTATPGRFPARNRLLAALGAVTVVVEAGVDSGALITAEWAANCDRPVMAVPHPLGSKNGSGCLQLIRDGADCICDVNDVLARAGLDGRSDTGDPGVVRLTESESVVYAVLDVVQPLSVETIVHQSGLPLARAVAALSSLELQGLCVRQGGSAWRAENAPGGRCKGEPIGPDSGHR